MSAHVGPARRVLRMKSRLSPLIALATGFGLLVHPARLYAQSAASTNHVLELDGTNSFVELPPHIFDGLPALTVEAWVKLDGFYGPGDALFFCFGDENQGLFVGNDSNTPLVKFALYDRSGERHPT